MNRDDAIRVIRESGFARLADWLIEQLLPSARIVVQDDPAGGHVDPALSSLGGLPCLPDDAMWPEWDKPEYLKGQIARLEEKSRKNPPAIGLRDIAAQMREGLPKGRVPLSFIGQVCLDELHANAPIPGWPNEGKVAFFFGGGWGYDPLERGNCRVVFVPARERVRLVKPPEGLRNNVEFPQRRVTFRREWTLPTDPDFDGYKLSDSRVDEYRALCRRLTVSSSEHEPVHRCGGHPQEIQGEMQLECELVTNGLYCGDPSGYEDPRVPQLSRGAQDWRLLLQVDSDEGRLGWSWGDAGRVYFWARQQDIEDCEFDSAWVILQCY